MGNKLIKYIGYVLFLIMFILFMKQCDNKLSFETVKLLKSDTIHTTHIDTINFKDTTYIVKIKKQYISYPDTVYIDSTKKIIYKYDVIIEDSLIKGNILSDIQTDGTLVYQEFKYTPKFPKYINRTDSIYITKEIIYNKLKFYGGLMIAPYKSPNIIPTLGIKTKKGYYLGTAYDIKNNHFLIDLKIKIR